jgi:hypothetical protein
MYKNFEHSSIIDKKNQPDGLKQGGDIQIFFCKDIYGSAGIISALSVALSFVFFSVLYTNLNIII